MILQATETNYDWYKQKIDLLIRFQLPYRIIGKAKESGLENKRGKGGKQSGQEPQLV